MNRLPLKGLRIIDFSKVLGAPYGASLLALMGAEVIKVESILYPDWTRRRNPVGGAEVNMNKLGITINLNQPQGIELAKRLVRISDVVVENFRPGAMEKLGLDYESLKQVKPDIIMVSLSGFGASGTEKHYLSYAPIFAAVSGLAFITGYPDGSPVTQRGSVDLRLGQFVAFSTLAALYHRRRTGVGQHIDIAATEALICHIGNVVMDYTMNKRNDCRRGNADDFMAPHNCYRCKGEDTWISLAVSTEEEWKAFCQVIGNPDWTKDDRFSDALSRWKNREELDRLVENWTVNYTPHEAMNMLQSAGVAAVPSFSNRDIWNDPHLRERGFTTARIEHPELGQRQMIGPPWKLSRTPAADPRPSPSLGQHNSYVFLELLGMTSDEMTELIESKVIY